MKKTLSIFAFIVVMNHLITAQPIVNYALQGSTNETNLAHQAITLHQGLAFNSESTALKFDGVDDYASFGELNLVDQFSFFFSAKLDTVYSSFPPGQLFLGKHNTSNAGWGEENIFLFGQYEGKYQIRVFADYIFYSDTLPDTLPHTYAIVVDNINSSINVKLYRDKSLILEKDVPSNSLDTKSTLPWVLGMDYDKFQEKTDFFKGEISNVSVFNYAIDELTIDSMITSVSGPTLLCESIVANYPLIGKTDNVLANEQLTLSGGLAFNQQGDALKFDGINDYASLAEVDLNTTFSISFEAKMDTVYSSFPPGQLFIGKHYYSSGGNENIFLFGQYVGKYQVRIMTDYTLYSDVLPDTAWHKYIVSIEAISAQESKVTLVRDNEVIMDKTIPYVLSSTTSTLPWVLGMDYDGYKSTSDFFKGEMRNVQMYNCVEDNDVVLTIGDSFSEIEQVLIYPNPASNQLKVSKNVKHIEVIDLQGKKILSSENHSGIVSLENIDAGVYKVVSYTAHKTYSTTIIVE